MQVEQIRKLCLSFPGATEHTIWHGDLTFKVADKMFAHTCLDVAPVWLSFKCSGENFAELTERQGIIPAPYLARAQWVALESKEALSVIELSGLLREAYDLVVARLPKKTREGLASIASKRKVATRTRSASRRDRQPR
jgi:predicted DNA-binding protein (MmcQ/YjbR family)